MDRIPKEEIEKINESLNKLPFIVPCKKDGGELWYTIDFFKLLLFLMRQKKYVLPKALMEKTNWKELTSDEKRMLLILMNLHPQTNNTVSLPIREVESEFWGMEKIDIDEPELVNDYYIFYQKEWFDFVELKQVFVNNFYDIIEEATFRFPGTDIPLEYQGIIETVCEDDDEIDLKYIALKNNMCEDAVVELFLKMIKLGFMIIEDCIAEDN